MGHRLRHRSRARPRADLPRAGRRGGARRGTAPALRRAEPGRARAARVVGERARPRRRRASARTASPYLVEFERALARRGAGGDGPGRPTSVARAAGTGAARTPPPTTSSTPDDRRVFDDLVAWRLDVSRAAAVPAFVVFDNKVLRSVARRPPRPVPTSCSPSSGVGPAKLERYGAAVLEIVGRHAASSHRLTRTSFTPAGGRGARRREYRRPSCTISTSPPSGIAQLCFDYAIERLRMDPGPARPPRLARPS